MTVEIRIGEVLLDRGAEADRRRIGEQLEAELARTLDPALAAEVAESAAAEVARVAGEVSA